MIFCLECDKETTEGYFRLENQRGLEDMISCVCKECSKELQRDK